jgi:hypothetical protein
VRQHLNGCTPVQLKTGRRAVFPVVTSDQAGFVTGQALVMDGGLSLTM